MKLLYDDRELVRQLEGERDYLRGRVQSLENTLKSLAESFQKLALSRPQTGQPLTKEAIAARLGVPVSVVDQIDLNALGVQIQGKRSL